MNRHSRSAPTATFVGALVLFSLAACSGGSAPNQSDAPQQSAARPAPDPLAAASRAPGSERRTMLARPKEELLVDESGDAADAFSIFDRLQQPSTLWLANPEQEFLDKLLREDLDRALAELPEHYRVVVVLADVEGLTYGEIAEALDVPIGTVRSRLARARSALQRTLWSVARDRGLQLSPAAGTRG